MVLVLPGSFDTWASRSAMTWDATLQQFILDVKAKPGRYFCKVIVDGQWICMREYPVEKDQQDNENNVIVV